MKNLLRTLCFALLASVASAVTPIPYTEGVSFSFRVAGVGGGILTVVDESPTAPSVGQSASNNIVESEMRTAWLRPGKTYTATYQFSGGTDYWLSFTEPPGYVLYIEKVPTNLIHGTQGGPGSSVTYEIELRPQANHTMAPLGAFSGIQLGKSVSWDLGLGMFGNGRSTGRVMFKQYDLSNNPASRSRLYYSEPLSYGRIHVIYDGPAGQTLRQISTPQGLADFVDDASNGYWIRFYTPSQLEGSPGNPYIIHGSPWKTIRVESPGANQLKITETEGSVSRISHATAGPITSGVFTWTLQEGNASTWVRTVTHNSTVPSGGVREVVATVRTGGTSGTIVAKTKYRYVTQGWGEELAEVVSDPDGAALRTTYDYYTTAPVAGSETNRGSYRRAKSVTQPTGKWTAWQYRDDWDRRGQTEREFNPFVDTPGIDPATRLPASISTTQGRVLSYTYEADWTGRYRRVSQVSETVGGIPSGKTNYGHVDSPPPGWPRETTIAFEFKDGANSQTSVTEKFRIDAGFDDAGNLIRQENADQSMTVWNRRGGEFNAVTGAFTANSGIYFTRLLEIRGSSSGVGAETLSSWSNQTFPSINVIPNKSTMSATIRDAAGKVLRSETWVYTGGGNFSLMTWTKNTYDIAGRLTESVDNNGNTVTHTYVNGRLESTVDATGVETRYTYDPLGRVATSTKKGAPATGAVLTGGYNYLAQNDIVTNYIYDGAGNVTQEVVSGGGLSLVSSATFDLAGRTVQQVAPGNFVTSNVYSAGGRIVTTTIPGGATRTTETYLDGQLRQVSGSGVIAEYYTYWVDPANGNRCRQQIIGGVNAAWTNTAWDWLGRTSEEWVPGWNGNATGSFWHYNNSGQLWKKTAPGVAPTLYVYDPMGVQYREGLDVNNNGNLDLAGDDYINEIAYSFFIDGSNRAAKQVTSKLYGSSGSGTATNASVSTQYLSNLGSGITSLSTVTDIFGNTTTTTTAINRSAKRVTTTTDAPDSSVDAVTISYNRLPVEARDNAGNIARYEYDALARKVKDIHPRTGAMTTTYQSGSNLVASMKDGTNTTIATYTYDSAGRVATLTNALGKIARYAYNTRGQKIREWGDTTYPIEQDYNSWGRLFQSKTFRGGTGWSGASWPSSTTGTADTTTWNYHAPTGLLASKTDADGKSVTYTYTQARQVATRTWAREVSTTYSYSPTTGLLTLANYSDTTPDVIFTYDRLGRIATLTDYTGTRTLTHCLCGKIEHEALGAAFYANRVITYKSESSLTGALGRTTGFTVGTSGNPISDHNVNYAYDGYGRLAGVTATLGGVAAGTFTYTRTPNSHLIGSLTETGSGLLQTRNYEPNRDLVSGFATTLPSRNLASYSYTNDVLGRRTVKVETGEMYSRYGPGLTTVYGYNDRSEVTSAQTYLGTDPSVATTAAGDALQGRSFYYAYDSLGNRTATTTNGQSSNYTTNHLNQIVSRTTPASTDVSGFAASNATVTVAGQPTSRQFDYFYRQHGLNNASNPVWASLAIHASVPGGGSSSETRNVYLAKAPEQFQYDEDGNLLSDGRWNYVWDAENRLVQMTTTSAAMAVGVPQRALQFRYDYAGRRVEKKVYENGAASPSVHLKFLYGSGDWNLLGEYDALNGHSLVRTYSWGLDLSQSTDGAGGVGGLLAIRDSATAATYLPTYDANGNVFALVNRASGAIAASYEYDAFGNTLRATGGAIAEKNPFRFSTKYTDAETQLIYYGYRYYQPHQGRFLGRDPSGERGGLNLYGFLSNDSVNRSDFLGLFWIRIPVGYKTVCKDVVQWSNLYGAYINVWGCWPTDELEYRDVWIDEAPGDNGGNTGGGDNPGGGDPGGGDGGGDSGATPGTPNSPPEDLDAPNKEHPDCERLRALQAHFGRRVADNSAQISGLQGYRDRVAASYNNDPMAPKFAADLYATTKDVLTDLSAVVPGPLGQAASSATGLISAFQAIPNQPPAGMLDRTIGAVTFTGNTLLAGYNFHLLVEGLPTSSVVSRAGLLGAGGAAAIKLYSNFGADLSEAGDRRVTLNTLDNRIHYAPGGPMEQRIAENATAEMERLGCK